ncbi:MAG TPA: c-type cytochrome [Campylobacterales bacterium]|nr:c-type cytochrome [Campylobacterales bacterium]
MKLLKSSLLVLALANTLFAATGAELLKKNCASCHLLETPSPDMIPTLEAPAMEAVIFHVKLAIKKEEKQKSFIVDYVQNPHASKSVCESNKVEKFGLMPSLKGKISKEDLDSITNYLLKNYPTPGFVSMIKEIQTNDKMNGLVNSPFLINQDALPHITKILLQNWDKAALGLSEKQKTKLLLIRQDTLSSVKKIKQEVATLEEEIIEIVVDAEELDTLDAKIEKVSKLKAEATKIHINCILDTIAILEDEQLEHLLPFWGS